MIATERIINFTTWVQKHSDGTISYAMWSSGGKQIQAKYGLGIFEARQSIGAEVLECRDNSFGDRRRDVDEAELFRMQHPDAHAVWMRLQSAADCVRLGPQFADKIIETTFAWLGERK